MQRRHDAAIQRAESGRLIAFQNRLDELMAQMDELQKKSESAELAGDEKLKEAIDEQAWIICARVWLYRNTGPLVWFNYREQMLDYLSYLDREIREDLKSDPENARENARLDEVHIAQKIVHSMDDVPMF